MIPDPSHIDQPKTMDSDLTVVKAGTGVLTNTADGSSDRASFVHLVAAIAGLINSGKRCLFVSSG